LSRNIFIFHGSNGSIDSHWYKWLKETLQEKTAMIHLLQMPTGSQQNLSNWLVTLEPFKKEMEDAILVGHSLGATFILDVLNQWDIRVHAAFLVSGFVGQLTVENEPNIPDFSEQVFSWERIKSLCSKFYVIHSDNDPYVPLERAQQLASYLGVELTVIKHAAHFQAQDGYTTFPFLESLIEKELKE